MRRMLKEGATTFFIGSHGKNMQDAYNNAVQDAIIMYGNDPYNGTISTTEGFIEVYPPNNDPRSKEFRDWVRSESINNAEKWGPALGVNLGNGEYLFFGWAVE